MEPRKEMINWGEQEGGELTKIKDDLTNTSWLSKVEGQGLRNYKNLSFD